MTAQRIDAIVFDLGGVLLDWDPRYLYRGLFTGEQEMEQFLAEICTSEWHRDHDLGVDIARSCEQLARLHPQHRQLIMAWAERSEEMIAGQFGETVELLGALKAAGMPCFALSNMERETYAVRRERFAFMSWFDGIVISGHEGSAKPDRRIFEILLQRYGLDPHRCVFIDDAAPNVETARELGMTGLLYRSAGQLRADLEDLGVSTAGAGH
jgi:2-haloacid dehalogenase